MQIFRSIAEVREWRRQCVLANLTVGFVPTMGALHAGHLSLVEASLDNNDRTMVSIFVNPSQFAPNEDLEAYPRTFDTDLALLAALGDVVVFAPMVSEMYPSGITLEVTEQRGAFVSVLGLSEQLEGVSRPHFFRGVATIVTKLFNVVTPTRAYFGQKDAQQTVVIKRMVSDLLLPVTIVVVPTVRAATGLALSSRNAYLSPHSQEVSRAIYAALEAAQEAYENGETSAAVLLDTFGSAFSLNELELEYVEVSHPETLEALKVVDVSVGAILSTAVRVARDDGGFARLIDNIVLEKR